MFFILRVLHRIWNLGTRSDESYIYTPSGYTDHSTSLIDIYPYKMQECEKSDDTRNPDDRKAGSTQIHGKKIKSPSTRLRDKIWYERKRNKHYDQKYSRSMEDLLWSTTLEFTEVTRSWYDRESSSLCLEHGDHYDDKWECDKGYMKDRHKKECKIKWEIPRII
jgi:hypothetical protein